METLDLAPPPLTNEQLILPPLIGLIGAGECGKDTVADYLVSTYEAAKYSSSDIIKEVFAKHFAWGRTARWARWAGYTHEGKNSPHPYLTHEDSSSMTNREVLEQIGDGLNKVDPLVLMRGMPPMHESTGQCVVDTSTREVRQAQFIKKHGGIIIYVRRPSSEAAAGKHHTARFYESWVADYILDNTGTLADLFDRTDKLLRLIHRTTHAGDKDDTA